MKTVIIEDEPLQKESLVHLLKTYCPYVDLVGEAHNVESGYALINEHQPELVFLDVHMPDGTGFDLLMKFQQIHFEVIFVTGFGDYAIKAFEFNALHFIHKPINDLQLLTAVGKAQQKIQQKTQLEHYKILLDNLRSPSNNPDNRISVPLANGMEFIKVKDIIRCESDAGNTSIYIKDKKRIYSTKHLKEYERLLSEYHFLRVHHSHLVNSNHIVKYLKNDGGYVLMSDQAKIPVSRRKKDALLLGLKNLGAL